MKVKWICIVLFSLLLCLPAVAMAQLCPNKTRYDANDDLDDHRRPSANGAEVAYQAKDDGEDYEIYLWKHRTSYPGGPPNHRGEAITDNNYKDEQPCLYGGRIAWIGWPAGGDSEVFYYDGSDIEQVTSTSDDEGQVHTAGKWVVWVQDPGTTSAEIYRWDSLSDDDPENLSNDSSRENRNPVVDLDGNVAWETYVVDDWDIFVYDESSSSKSNVSGTNNLDEIDPSIWGGEVVWEQENGSNAYIYHYDISTEDTTQITTISESRNPDIHEDGDFVWQFRDSANGDWDVYLYSGGNITNITPAQPPDEDFHDVTPEIEYGTIAWIELDDSYDIQVRMVIGSCSYYAAESGHSTGIQLSLGTNTVAWIEDEDSDQEWDLNVFK